jgi:predicted CXXCH cytochrome family protein
MISMMAASAVVGLLTVPSAQAAGTVVGSAHDLRATGGGTAIGTGLVQVCVPCHTPHQAATAAAQTPLWNHTASTFVGNYGVYTSTTLNAAPQAFGAGTIGSLNTSQMCMSCHDGTVSVLSMYKQPNLGGTPTPAAIAGYTAGVMTNTNPGYVGTSLVDDHPVNFTYNAALATADGALTSPFSAACVTNSAPCNTPLFTGGLSGSAVQCASCHTPHDPTNLPFLRVDNTASALCLTCHIK